MSLKRRVTALEKVANPEPQVITIIERDPGDEEELTPKEKALLERLLSEAKATRPDASVYLLDLTSDGPGWNAW